MTVAVLLPQLSPLRLKPSKYKNKLRKTHCYKLRNIKDQRIKLRRLGSGFLPPLMPDSLILDHLLLRMPVNLSFLFFLCVNYPLLLNDKIIVTKFLTLSCDSTMKALINILTLIRVISCWIFLYTTSSKVLSKY